MSNPAIQPVHLLVDGVVLLAYFFGIVGIGLWAGRRNRNLTEFALGGRSIPWWAVLASIVAAETSAATFLGTPAEGFKTRSFIYGQLAIGTVLARVIVAFTFIRPYYQYGVQSIYEFLNIRFGPWTKNLASAIFLFTRVLGIGVRLYLGGVIIKVIWEYLFPEFPVNLWIYFAGVLFVTLMTTVYTAVGGIKAVVWTDLIQATLMLSSMVVAIVLLATHIPGGFHTVDEKLGGFPPIFQLGMDFSRGLWPAVTGILAEPYTVFTAIIASTFLTMATHGTDQDMVQRMLTAPNFRKSQLSLVLSGLADLPIAGCFLLIGILLGVYYQVRPDPNLPAADNEVFAYYIVTQMPIGLRGLIVAGVFATMMGSTSAALNAMATSFTKDFFLPYLKRGEGDRSAIYAARAATVGFGAIMVGVATMAASAVLRDSKLTIIPIAIGSLGYTYGALLGVFLLGMLTKTRGRDITNVIGMLVGIAAVGILGRVSLPGFNIGKLFSAGQFVYQDWTVSKWLPAWWPALAWPWFVLVGTLFCFAVSSLFRTPPERIGLAEEHVANWKLKENRG